MRKVVWVDAWQLECCGTLFAKKDVIRWTVIENPSPPAVREAFGDDAPHIDLAEEHHSSPGALPELRGRVRSIQAVRVRYHRDPANPAKQVAVPGSARLTPLRRVDGVDFEAGDLTLCGYLVEIDAIGGRA